VCFCLYFVLLLRLHQKWKLTELPTFEIQQLHSSGVSEGSALIGLGVAVVVATGITTAPISLSLLTAYTAGERAVTSFGLVTSAVGGYQLAS
jgi:hypothetical protein